MVNDVLYLVFAVNTFVYVFSSSLNFHVGFVSFNFVFDIAFAVTSFVSLFRSYFTSILVGCICLTFISALNSNYVLDISTGVVKNTQNIQLYQSNGTNAQKFKLTKI